MKKISTLLGSFVCISIMFFLLTPQVSSGNFIGGIDDGCPCTMINVQTQCGALNGGNCGRVEDRCEYESGEMQMGCKDSVKGQCFEDADCKQLWKQRCTSAD